MILPFNQKKVIILVSSPTLIQKQLIALGAVSDFNVGWFTESSSESVVTPNHIYFNNSNLNSGSKNSNSNNSFNSNDKKRKLNDDLKVKSNSKIDDNIPITFETCWDIVNFIICNYTKDALILTPIQLNYLLDIGLLTFNSNINLLVIDRCQKIQDKTEYSLYAKIMTCYKKKIDKEILVQENKGKNDEDDDQNVRKKRRLNLKKSDSAIITRIVGIIDKKKEDKKVNIEALEDFYQSQMVWAYQESDDPKESSFSNVHPVKNKMKMDTGKEEDKNEISATVKNECSKLQEMPMVADESNVLTALSSTDTVKSIEKVNIEKNKKDGNKELKKQNNKLTLKSDNQLSSIFFSNETIINYHQCIDIDWTIYDEQVKIEQQKQKQKNPQDSFFHQLFKIPSSLFTDMENASINDRFKILLIIYLKIMEFLVKKMSWLNDYKNLENTKRLIKLIKNEYKESGLWCACNLARIYVENLYQTFCYHIVKEDYALLLNKHYHYTQYLFEHFNFETLNNDQFLSPKIMSIIQCLDQHIKKINQKKVIIITIIIHIY